MKKKEQNKKKIKMSSWRNVKKSKKKIFHHGSSFTEMLLLLLVTAAQVLLRRKIKAKKLFQLAASESSFVGIRFWSLAVAFNRQLAVCPKFSSFFCSSSFFSRVTDSKVKQVMQAVNRVTLWTQNNLLRLMVAKSGLLGLVFLRLIDRRGSVTLASWSAIFMKKL